MRIVILGLLMSILTLGASAAEFSNVPPPPIDLYQLLSMLGLGGQALALVTVYGLFVQISTIIVPWLPVPTDQSSVWWRVLYALINEVGAHNYRNASNALQRPPVAPSPAPPAAALAAVAAGLVLAACTPQSQTKVAETLASPGGQLFCAIQFAGGGTMVAGIVKTGIAAGAAAAPAAGVAAPAAVLVTDMTKKFVDDACAQAASKIRGAQTGVPVSPPPDPTVAPRIAITTTE